jgi:hypothetical protein
MTCEVCGKKIHRGVGVGTHVHRSCESEDGFTIFRFENSLYLANKAIKELHRFKKHADLWRRSKNAPDNRFDAMSALLEANACCDRAFKTLEPILQEEDL